MKRLEFNQLATFVAIVDAGSITKASSTVHRTQAAISIQLKKLEDSIGKQLLHRSYNQFTLTREGEILLSYARKILNLSEEAFYAINDEEISGTVRFGIPDGYARAFIQKSIRHFITRYPKVRIQIKNDSSRNLYKSLENGELDLIIATRDPQKAGGKLLRREKICWVSAEDYILNLEQPQPLALYEQGCAYRRKVIEQLNQNDIDWYVSFECQGVSGFDIAISNGLAISALAESLVKDEWRTLEASDGLPDLGDIEIELHTIPGNVNEAIYCLAEELTQSIGNINLQEKD